jgi:hypothetical protein
MALLPRNPIVVMSLVLVATGCATPPTRSPAAEVADDAVRCLEPESCVMLMVDNGVVEAQVVRLNEAFLGQVEGLHSRDFSVSQSQLKNGACASVSVKPTMRSTIRRSDEVCITPQGRFSLRIMPQRIWLTAWYAEDP